MRHRVRLDDEPVGGRNVSIIEAVDHPQVWRGWFKDRKTWGPWRSFLAALFGLPMSEADLGIYQQCTGRTQPPEGATNEAWLVVGRRGGKSMILALIACYLAIFRDWRQYLSPGEVGTIKIIATDRRQARVIHRYCRALLTKVPAFTNLVERDDNDEIRLRNGIAIEVQTASFRSVRGHTMIACLCDEIAFWRSEETAANPDSEILAAIRPAMATIPNAMLLAASSPYARRGELWNHYRRHYGQESQVLVWKADTRTMNSTVPQSVIDEAIERDPASAAAEYGAQFRTDIEALIQREVVEACTVPGRHELPPVPGIAYTAFVDPSGGSSDAMTVSLSHRDKDGRVILDAVRERRPPFSPEAVVAEFAGLLKSYHVARVHGDRYGGEWPREQFRKAGIDYVPSEKPKSDLYLELLPLLNGGKVELLDHPRLHNQLIGLERRTTRGSGRESIDHAPGAHDDIANAVAGALVMSATPTAVIFTDETLAILRQPRRVLAMQPSGGGPMEGLLAAARRPPRPRPNRL
jgi:hypothetical protein